MLQNRVAGSAVASNHGLFRSPCSYLKQLLLPSCLRVARLVWRR